MKPRHAVDYWLNKIAKEVVARADRTTPAYMPTLIAPLAERSRLRMLQENIKARAERAATLLVEIEMLQRELLAYEAQAPRFVPRPGSYETEQESEVES